MDYVRSSTDTTLAIYALATGNISIYFTDTNGAGSPLLYRKSKTMITEGNGSYQSPYQVG